MREQCPKTNRHQWCCEKLGTSHDVKSFVIGLFLEWYVVKIAKWLSLLKNIKHACQSKIYQFLAISSKICPENSLEISCFLPIVLSAKLAPKNFRESVSENATKFDFFSATFQKPCSLVWFVRFDCLKISRTEVGINLEVNWLCLCNLAHFLWWKQSNIRWNVCFNFTLLNLNLNHRETWLPKWRLKQNF